MHLDPLPLCFLSWRWWLPFFLDLHPLEVSSGDLVVLVKIERFLIDGI